MAFIDFPGLNLKDWFETKNQLHLYFQILGKIRLHLFPKQNHYWHAFLFITGEGISTGPIPYENTIFELTIDLVKHRLVASISNNEKLGFSIVNLTIKQFYEKLLNMLKKWGVVIDINPFPYDPVRVNSQTNFFEDNTIRIYDAEYVSRFWYILTKIYPVFESIKGNFIGKTSAVFLGWQTLDLNFSIFTGKKAPEIPKEDKILCTNVYLETYSHECLTIGFWPGDSFMPEPVFYVQPNPNFTGLTTQPLAPSQARWILSAGTMMALLSYKDCIQHKDPLQVITDFIGSSLFAVAQVAKWDLNEMRLNTT